MAGDVPRSIGRLRISQHNRSRFISSAACCTASTHPFRGPNRTTRISKLHTSLIRFAPPHISISSVHSIPLCLSTANCIRFSVSPFLRFSFSSVSLCHRIVLSSASVVSQFRRMPYVCSVSFTVCFARLCICSSASLRQSFSPLFMSVDSLVFC